MQGTIGKWAEYEIPEWFDKDAQKSYSDPEQIVHFKTFHGTPVWEDGFEFKKPKWGALNLMCERAETLTLIEYIHAAKLYGWVVSEGWGFPDED